MPYRPHTLVEFGGELAQRDGTPDIWACGIRTIAHNEQAPAPNPAQFLDAIATALAAWFTSNSQAMANTASLTYLKINNIDAAGHYADPTNTNVHNFGAGTVGASAGIAPSFCSVVTTWETNNARGLAHRGRIYLPNYTFPSVGSQLATGAPTTVAQSGEKLCVDVLGAGRSASYENYLEPWVFSKTLAQAHPIVAVTADNVYDVQRRRKNQVSATRSPRVPLTYT